MMNLEQHIDTIFQGLEYRPLEEQIELMRAACWRAPSGLLPRLLDDQRFRDWLVLNKAGIVMLRELKAVLA